MNIWREESFWTGELEIHLNLRILLKIDLNYLCLIRHVLVVVFLAKDDLGG